MNLIKFIIIDVMYKNIGIWKKYIEIIFKFEKNIILKRERKMIIRKPTKIELKPEEDQIEYE